MAVVIPRAILACAIPTIVVLLSFIWFKRQKHLQSTGSSVPPKTQQQQKLQEPDVDDLTPSSVKKKSDVVVTSLDSSSGGSSSGIIIADNSQQITEPQAATNWVLSTPSAEIGSSLSSTAAADTGIDTTIKSNIIENNIIIPNALCSSNCIEETVAVVVEPITATATAAVVTQFEEIQINELFSNFEPEKVVEFIEEEVKDQVEAPQIDRLAEEINESKFLAADSEKEKMRLDQSKEKSSSKRSKNLKKSAAKGEDIDHKLNGKLKEKDLDFGMEVEKLSNGISLLAVVTTDYDCDFTKTATTDLNGCRDNSLSTSEKPVGNPLSDNNTELSSDNAATNNFANNANANKSTNCELSCDNMHKKNNSSNKSSTSENDPIVVQQQQQHRQNVIEIVNISSSINSSNNSSIIKIKNETIAVENENECFSTEVLNGQPYNKDNDDNSTIDNLQLTAEPIIQNGSCEFSDVVNGMGSTADLVEVGEEVVVDDEMKTSGVLITPELESEIVEIRSTLIEDEIIGVGGCGGHRRVGKTPEEIHQITNHINGVNSSAYGSASHSPTEEMLGSSTMSNYSDLLSEGSSDSGNGGSDIHIPLTDASAVTGEILMPLQVYEFELPQTLCGRLIGNNGRHVKHIKTKTHAIISLKRHPFNVELKLCAVIGNQEDISAALALIRKKFPEGKFPDVSLVQVNQPLVSGFPVPETFQLNLPDGVSCDVILSSTICADHFFLQQPTHPTYPSLSRLDQFMLACYQNASAPELPRPIEAGIICAAPLLCGWYRAQVVIVYPESDECDVKFVDYGGYLRIPISNLRQIRSDFMTLPFQATECLLANVVPIDENEGWTKEANATFEELAQGQILQSQIVAYSSEGIPLVHLFRIQGAATTFINRELVNCGLAHWVQIEG